MFLSVSNLSCLGQLCLDLLACSQSQGWEIVKLHQFNPFSLDEFTQSQWFLKSSSKHALIWTTLDRLVCRPTCLNSALQRQVFWPLTLLAHLYPESVVLDCSAKPNLGCQFSKRTQELLTSKGCWYSFYSGWQALDNYEHTYITNWLICLLSRPR